MTSTIQLNSPGVYSPGQDISGNIVCIINNIETIGDISCWLVGSEQVNFYDRVQKLHFTSYNVFLKDEINICPGAVQPGTYKFPFSFKLPDSMIPSSFKHEFGRVKYKIASVLKRDGHVYKKSQKIEISVSIDFHDMMHEITMMPITYPFNENVNTFCCWLSSRPLFMEITLEKDAFLVGESIFIKLAFRNPFYYNVSMDIALVSHTEFISDTPSTRTHVDKEILSKISKELSAPIYSSDRQPTNYSLELPIPMNVTIPCLARCTLIRRKYTATVMILDSCWGKVEFPIHIKLGHISAQGPRPISFPQLPTRGRAPLNPRNAIPVGRAPEVSRPPYPVDDPMPFRSRAPPPLPTVQLPPSYMVRSRAPTSVSIPMPMPRTVAGPSQRITSRRPAASAPLAYEEQVEMLLSEYDIELPTPPPTYDEAMKRSWAS